MKDKVIFYEGFPCVVLRCINVSYKQFSKEYENYYFYCLLKDKLILIRENIKDNVIEKSYFSDINELIESTKISNETSGIMDLKIKEIKI